MIHVRRKFEFVTTFEELLAKKGEIKKHMIMIIEIIILLIMTFIILH